MHSKPLYEYHPDPNGDDVTCPRTIIDMVDNIARLARDIDSETWRMGEGIFGADGNRDDIDPFAGSPGLVGNLDDIEQTLEQVRVRMIQFASQFTR